MADTSFPIFTKGYSGTVPNIKLIDNGDGTYSPDINVALTVGDEVSIRSPAPAAAVAATIDQSSNTLTASVDLGTERLHRIVMSAAWTSAALTFMASVDGSTFYDLYDVDGEVTIGSSVVGATRVICVDPAIFFGIRYLKIRSGTTASAVTQASTRTLSLVTVPR